MTIVNHYKVIQAYDGYRVGSEFFREEGPRELAFVEMGFLIVLGATATAEPETAEAVAASSVANPRRRGRGIVVSDRPGGDADVLPQLRDSAGGEDS